MYKIKGDGQVLKSKIHSRAWQAGAHLHQYTEVRENACQRERQTWSPTCCPECAHMHYLDSLWTSMLELDQLCEGRQPTHFIPFETGQCYCYLCVLGHSWGVRAWGKDQFSALLRPKDFKSTLLIRVPEPLRPTGHPQLQERLNHGQRKWEQLVSFKY